jgi:regulatory protein
MAVDPGIYDKLLRYCSYSERCRADVAKKLSTLKVDKEEHVQYIAALESSGYLNEKRFVQSFVNGHYKNKKWGKQKIKTALKQKRLPAELIDLFLQEIEQEGYEDQLLIQAEKKLANIRKGTPQEKRVKLTRFLVSKGYEMDKVFGVLKKLDIK